MVQIHIDTKNDSHEEIKETIRYLQGIVGETPVQVETGEAQSYESPMNMFGGSDSSSESTTEAPAAFSMFDEPKKEDFADVSQVFGSDDDAPSDVGESASDDDAPVIEIVEF